MRRGLLLAGAALAFVAPARAGWLIFGGDPRVPALIKELETGDWSARIHAVHELEFIGPDAKRGLVFAAGDGDWQVRMAAVHALGSIGTPAVPVLKSVWKTEPCRVVRLIALHWLGGLEPEENEFAAITDVYHASVRELNDCANQAGPGRLARRDVSSSPAPPSPDAELAAAVAAAKAYLEPSRARRAADPSPPRLAAPAPKTQIAVLPSPAPQRPSAQPSLFGRLAKGNDSLSPRFPPGRRDRSLSAPPLLMADGGSGPYDALQTLIVELKAADSRMRSRAADELGKMGARASPAVGPLIAALNDDSSRVRSSASLALGNIGPASDPAVPILVLGLRDSNVDAAYSAAVALSRIGTPKARQAFDSYVHDEVRRGLERPQPES